MRMSCNGCRVLRKGCSEDCSIRPCLQWIKTPEAQANATVFLAKFYGRAGLINLLSAAPDHLRPAVFRSLLYEACGRIVNPIYGSVGLLWSGSWQMCQAAVEAVLTGAPIAQIPSETAAAAAPPVPVPAPPLKPYDIRHVAKDRSAGPSSPEALRRVSKPRTRFKRSAKPKPKPTPNPLPIPDDATALCNLSYESSGSHAAEASGGENESAFSIETSSHVSQGEPDDYPDAMGLELTLGHEPASRSESRPRQAAEARRCDVGGWGDDTCRVELGLELPA